MRTQKFSNVESLFSALDTERKGREDIVVPVGQLGMTDGKLVVEGESYTLSKLATKQMAWRLGIAPVYWTRMVKYSQFDLLDENANRWISLHKPEDTYLISRKENLILSFLSPKYKIVDDYETLHTYMDGVKQAYGDKVSFRTGGYSAENGQAYIQLITQELDDSVAKDDPYIAGSSFKFSDTGGGIGVSALIYRQVCSNGMMGFKDGKNDRVSLNGKYKEDRNYRQDPTYLEEYPMVINMIRSLGKRDPIKPEIKVRLENLRALKEKPVDDLEAVIYTLKPQLGLSDESFQALLTSAVADKIDNMYDLVQEITKFAQNTSVDEQLRLEQVGGWLTDNRGKVLDHVLINVAKMREKLDKKAKKEE